LSKEYGHDRFREKTGLPVASYFSGPKIQWILENVSEAKTAAQKGLALFGTIETWIIWWLTGGPKGGAHVTDVTNASRTLMMDLKTLQWDQEILTILSVPEQILPRIVPSIDHRTWGHTRKNGPFQATIPICGALGDQQASLVGHTCFEVGETKNTYGTGCFLLHNTGNKIVASKQGLLTTIAYQVRGQNPVFCLEGSVAVAGALVQWLRDNLGIIQAAPEIEKLALSVENNGGAFIVPAFSGLFAPYWRSNARGAIMGLTRFVSNGHLARAVLEATAYQTRDIVEAMNRDSGVTLSDLKVDGGMVQNNLLMQIQADILDLPVIRPQMSEITALGAAYAAGVAANFWSGFQELKKNWVVDRRWEPQTDKEDRRQGYAYWQKAVQRTFDWLE
jgi:glycerol kinase